MTITGMTILGNVLTVGKTASGEECSSWPHPQPGGRLEGVGGGKEKMAWQRTSLWRYDKCLRLPATIEGKT
jgi:hypothetical protein